MDGKIATIALSVILGGGLGFGLSYVILARSEPYIHSQLLQSPPENITAYNVTSGWILNWTLSNGFRRGYSAKNNPNRNAGDRTRR